MSAFKRFLGKTYLRLIGWDWSGVRPDEPKFVVIAAPHTSNWDLFHMAAFAFVFDIPLAWLGKHTLFQGPGKRIFRMLGGIPVDRRAPQGLVAQVAEEFARRDKLVVAIPPEGTRGLREHWKSGFYYIALAAKVPILMGYLDFARKQGGYGPLLWPTGDVKADMDQIRAFYADKTGKHPELFGPIRLRSEDNLEDADARLMPVMPVEAAPDEAMPVDRKRAVGE